MDRITEKTIGCFEYHLKDHKAEVGEFGTYDAFFDYSMAVRMLGKYEDTGLMPEEIGALQCNEDTRHSLMLELTAEVERLKSELEQVKAERDKAIADLRHNDACSICVGSCVEISGCECGCGDCKLDCRCRECRNEDKWQWRGMEANHEND